MRQLDITKTPQEEEVQADIDQHAELQNAIKTRQNMIWLATQV